MKLDFYQSAQPNGHGVLVVPGGGYGFLALDHEGEQIARWLNARGFAAWVLSYTIASEATPAPIYPQPQHDALNAIAQIRATGRVQKLGIFGFSAGGHLSAFTATNPEAGLDFAILAYPVISMEEGATHGGSRQNLLGENPDAQRERELSAHLRVSPQTPPTFLFHTANDEAVPVQNSLLFALALAEQKVPFQLLILPDGPHGIGLAQDDAQLDWTFELQRWLKTFAT